MPIKLTFKGAELQFAGWGKIYEERATSNGKILTSCMTDHNGPQPYNFRPCAFSGVMYLYTVLGSNYTTLKF